MKKMLTTMFLYGILGGVLGYAGVSFSENPLTFLSIVAVVVAIDLNSYYHGISTEKKYA